MNTQSRLQVFCLIALFLFPALSLRGQQDIASQIDAYVGYAMKDWAVPGLAIAIVKDDQMVFARGYGVREIDKPGAVDAQTLFAVASNSKAFTATLLAMLVAENRLAWDDRVIDHLPDFQMYDPHVSREMRVHDLLIHHSGLPTFGGDHLWIGNTLSRSEIIGRLRYLQPTAPFRTRFQYQNLMYLVAGEVYPAIAGESWDEGVRRRIFAPLGMKATNTSIARLTGNPNVATPHEHVNGVLRAIDYDNLDNVAPAAALNSNVIDMAAWMRFNLNQGELNGQRLLPAAAMRELHRIHIARPISEQQEEVFGTRFFGYGLGWGILDYSGKKLVTHSGGMSGMISLQMLLPEEQLGVMILTNHAPTSLPWAIGYQVVDFYLDQVGRDWNAYFVDRRRKREAAAEREEAELQARRAAGTRPSHPLAAYAGRYHDDFSGPASVRLAGEELVFDYNFRHIGSLEHWHYNTFRVHWRHPIFDMDAKTFLTFKVDEAGEVSGLTVRFYDPIDFVKMDE